VDYRPQAAYWAEIRETLGPDVSIIALTQDYENRLAYWGWLRAAHWPTSGDLNQAQARGNQRDIKKLFAEIAQSKSYFLVTDLDDFSKQAELKAQLEDYPLQVQGDGYLIYDLQNPLENRP
jgi:hypothetical protein